MIRYPTGGVSIHFTFPRWRDAAGRYANTPQAIQNGVKEVGEMYKNRAAIYPSQSGLTMTQVYGLHMLETEKGGFFISPFKTVRQHRWFFANMPSIPYTRTSLLASSWIAKSAGPLTVDVTNTTQYGGYLHSPSGQSMYASQSGWKTTDAIRDEYMGEALAIMKSAVDAALGSK